MTEERALDISAARAMGWQAEQPVFEDGQHEDAWSLRLPSGTFFYGNERLGATLSTPEACWETFVPRYSTDPACIGEMLEWAKSQGWPVALGTVPKREGPAQDEEWEALVGESWRSARGATPQLALARAIAATKE